jgi:hypothetical protein
VSEPPNPPATDDVVGRLLAQLDHLLDQFHDKILRPLLIAGRFVAFGFVLVLAGLVVIVMLLVGVSRLLDVYLFAGRVWATDLLLGVALIVGGLVAWRGRRPVRLRK